MAVAPVPNPSIMIARHAFTVEDYHLMGQSGIFTEDDRVELIDGEIVDMTPIGNDHSGVVDQLTEFFCHAAYKKAIVRIQNPVRMSDYSEPQPDLLLLRRRADFYRKGAATAKDVLLLIEVADSSLTFDRKIKIPLYAKTGIPEVWIVNLPGKSLEVFRDPAGDQFQHIQTLKAPGSIACLAFPDQALNLSDLFPD